MNNLLLLKIVLILSLLMWQYFANTEWYAGCICNRSYSRDGGWGEYNCLGDWIPVIVGQIVLIYLIILGQSVWKGQMPDNSACWQ
jgi:hypothetical protein